MNERRQFRRDANLETPPGHVVAEFANGHMALDFIKLCLDKSYTVTAGVNLPFAIRKRIPESVASTPSGADADLQALIPSGPAGGFLKIGIGVTDKGKAALPELARLLAKLPHGDLL